jgi:hypothetical protein
VAPLKNSTGNLERKALPRLPTSLTSHAGQREPGQLPAAAVEPQALPQGPDPLKLQRSLLPDRLPLVPGGGAWLRPSRMRYSPSVSSVTVAVTDVWSAPRDPVGNARSHAERVRRVAGRSGYTGSPPDFRGGAPMRRETDARPAAATAATMPGREDRAVRAARDLTRPGTDIAQAFSREPGRPFPVHGVRPGRWAATPAALSGQTPSETWPEYKGPLCLR